jgi:hypothetical protein
MRSIAIIGLLLFSVGCSPSDPQFCECLEKSDAFNEASAEVIAHPEKTQTFETQKKLKVEKEKACEEYLDMSGEDMLKRKADCE